MVAPRRELVTGEGERAWYTLVTLCHPALGSVKVHIWDPVQAPPVDTILFVHGHEGISDSTPARDPNRGEAHRFYTLVDSFQYRVLVLENTAYGGSPAEMLDGPASRELLRWKRSLLGVFMLEHLLLLKWLHHQGIDSMHLMGHSGGSTIARILAVLQPESFRSLITDDTSSLSEFSTLPPEECENDSDICRHNGLHCFSLSGAGCTGQRLWSEPIGELPTKTIPYPNTALNTRELEELRLFWKEASRD